MFSAFLRVKFRIWHYLGKRHSSIVFWELSKLRFAALRGEKLFYTCFLFIILNSVYSTLQFFSCRLTATLLQLLTKKWHRATRKVCWRYNQIVYIKFSFMWNAWWFFTIICYWYNPLVLLEKCLMTHHTILLSVCKDKQMGDRWGRIYRNS